MPMIYGSSGHVFANSDGVVTGFDSRDNDNGTSNDAYGDIARFDFDEYRAYYGQEPDHIDILDVGYWLLDGAYEAPEPDFRSAPIK